jgi:hypothetical protein
MNKRLLIHPRQTPLPPVTPTQGEVEVLVGQREAPEVWSLEPDSGAMVELGPFVGSGMDFRGSGIMAIYRFPTVSRGCVCTCTRTCVRPAYMR